MTEFDGCSWSRGPQSHRHDRAALADEGPLDSGPLGPLDRNPRVELTPGLPELARLWGADLETGSLSCPIPNHTFTALIGTPPDEREPRLLCSCTGRSRSLGEVRAARAYGQDKLLTNIEIATWTRLLGFEIGCFSPIAVAFPALPAHASATAFHVRERLVLFFGLRWADYPARPLPFAVRFAAAWCELGYEPARLALLELQQHGVIKLAERLRRNIALYLPGDVDEPCVGCSKTFESPSALKFDDESARP